MENVERKLDTTANERASRSNAGVETEGESASGIKLRGEFYLRVAASSGKKLPRPPRFSRGLRRAGDRGGFYP